MALSFNPVTQQVPHDLSEDFVSGKPVYFLTIYATPPTNGVIRRSYHTFRTNEVPTCERATQWIIDLLQEPPIKIVGNRIKGAEIKSIPDSPIPIPLQYLADVLESLDSNAQRMKPNELADLLIEKENRYSLKQLF
jgi:hypothetical protein